MITLHDHNGPIEAAVLGDLTSAHVPAVFRGGARSWLPPEAGEGLQVLEWLEGTIGHRIVPFSVGLPGDVGFLGNATLSSGKVEATTLTGRREFRQIAREMIREVQTPTGHLLYVQSLPIDSFAPELKEIIRLPADQLPPSGHWRAWIGTGNHHGYLHVDGTENLFCLLTGTKRFLLGPFNLLPDAYVGPLEGGAYGSLASVVNSVRPDLAQFPRYARVLETAVEVTLTAGDILYLPCGWWHAVESEGFNMSVNYWWYDVDDRARTEAEAAFMRSMLSFRRLPRHWREYWKLMLDNFVFQLDGDPFKHIPADQQGFAGAPTPERLLFLRSWLAQAAQATHETQRPQ